MPEVLRTLLIALLLSAAASAQTPTQPPPPATATEYRISPEEANELLETVDAVLHADSVNTKLPILHPVKRQLASRDQVQKFVETRMKDDEQAQRLARSAVVLKKFGLLPRDFDLESFLVDLLREQVAGYYDAKTKTVYLLDWLPPAVQMPVMAHELTHALQDQNFDLEKWVKAAEPRKKGNPQMEIASDEQIAARQAVVEGQAMAAMIDYMLVPTGGSVVDSPAIVKAIQSGMMEGPGSEVFQRAPLYLREALLFPYEHGLNFVRELLIKGGKQQAYAGVFKNPPQDTLEIMAPAHYLSGRRVAPLAVPNFDSLLGSGYQRFDVGAVGAFDIAILARQFGTEEQSNQLWPNWRGGYYYAVKKKSAAPDALGIVYLSRWATPEAANEFASVYRSSVAKRYKIVPIAQDLGAATPFASGGGSDCGCEAGPAADSSRFSTTDGPVSVEVKGDYVLVLESLEGIAEARLRQAALTSMSAPAPALVH